MIIHDYRDKLWDLVIWTESGLQQNRNPAFFQVPASLRVDLGAGGDSVYILRIYELALE